jgi:hypothetical protein
MNLLRFALAPLALALGLLPLAGCGGGGSPGSCNTEQNSLSSSFASNNVSKGYLACHADSDCEWSSVSQAGACVAACGALSNMTSASDVAAAASSTCAGFDTTCSEPLPACPANSPPICATGTCATYDVDLSPPTSTLGTLAVGSCLSFEAVFSVGYPTYPKSSVAPHDIPVPVSATLGTLFADTACTQVLATIDPTTMYAMGSLTVAEGSSRTSFGFRPTAAGDGFLVVGGVTSGFTAQ